jgi:transcriptional regulator with XRE-family HTH domain
VPLSDPFKPKPIYDATTLFAANLRRLRAEGRWKTRAFAEHAGLSLGSLYTIEHAKQQSITLATAERIARALGVHVSTLVSPTDQERKAWNGEEVHALVAASIRARRAERGWVQEELATRAQVQRDILSKIESQRRTPTLKVLERLATALDTSVEVLLSPLPSALSPEEVA